MTEDTVAAAQEMGAMQGRAEQGKAGQGKTEQRMEAWQSRPVFSWAVQVVAAGFHRSAVTWQQSSQSMLLLLSMSEKGGAAACKGRAGQQGIRLSRALYSKVLA